MSMSTHITLENERAFLRPLQVTDFDYLLPYSLHEPENWHFGLENAAGEENLKKYIEQALEGSENCQAIPFIIYDKQAGAYAGSSRYYQINLKHRRLAIGYSWLGNDFKNTGLNTNVKFLMLKYAFDTLEIERVEFMADALNERSIHAILSLGATFEGILRNHAEKPDGNRRNTAVFSILKQEWLELVKPSLLQKISR